jgi:tRNA G18 (ribose-2'-O)-methylase SpoU
LIYTLVENVRSAYNVGAIFRTADGAGIAKLFLCGISARPPHREIHKVALGAEENVPWEYRADALEIVAELKRAGVQIVALESGSEGRAYDSAPYRLPLCLIVGHELRGVSEGLLRTADLSVKIPMLGKKTSLNVAVAYGIAVYEILKIKNKQS